MVCRHTWWVYSWCLCAPCKGTLYFLQAIHLRVVILERTPTLATWCMDAHTLSHCTRCPCASRAHQTIRYPASGMEFLNSMTRASSSSSVHVLYKALTDNLFSVILLNCAARDTPSKFETNLTGSPSSIRWVRLVVEI